MHKKAWRRRWDQCQGLNRKEKKEFVLDGNEKGHAFKRISKWPEIKIIINVKNIIISIQSYIIKFKWNQ